MWARTAIRNMQNPGVKHYAKVGLYAGILASILVSTTYRDSCAHLVQVMLGSFRQ